MISHSRIYELLYLIAALAELLSHLIDVPIFHWIGKPLLMIALVLYFNSSLQDRKSTTAKLLNAGLFFAWVGDVVLMLQFGKAEGEEVSVLPFLAGLASFLITHCCYIGVFALSATGHKSLIKSKPLIVVPLMVIAGANYNLLLPHLGNMAIPVFIYTCAIATMVAFAVNRYSAVTSKSFWLVMVGAALFMVSDTIIGLNKFLYPFQESELLIMTTYIPAQYLIIKGLINKEEIK